MNKEVTASEVWDAMLPATFINSSYAEKILSAFADISREEARGTKGQNIMDYAISLGTLALHFQETTGKHPVRNGIVDINANHLFGSEIVVNRSLPPVAEAA